MKICIITDDNAGFTQDEVKKLGIGIVPMPVIINGEIYFENKNIDQEQFYLKQNGGSDIITSQPSPGSILQLWDEKLKDFEQIVHIPMSSGLSEECNTAKMLAKDYEGKVFVVDNHRISVTLKDSVYEAINLVKKGYSGEEIKNILEESAFDSSIYIAVDTLKYLKKGGRITPAAALFGSTLHIKPILSIFGHKLDSYKKAVGMKKAKQIVIDAIINDVNTKFSGSDKNKELSYGVAFTNNYDEAVEFKKEFAKQLGINEDTIIMNPLSLSVATHIGEGAFAITCTKKLNK